MKESGLDSYGLESGLFIGCCNSVPNELILYNTAKFMTSGGDNTSNTKCGKKYTNYDK